MNDVSFLVTLTIVVGTANLLLRAASLRGLERERQAYWLQFPYDLKIESVTSFMRSLAALLAPPRTPYSGEPTVAFETRSDHDELRHRLIPPGAQAEHILAQLRAAIPGVRITPEEPGTKLAIRSTWATELKLTSLWSPLKITNPASITNGLLASMQPVGRNEELVTQLVVVPARSLPIPKLRDPRSDTRPWPIRIAIRLLWGVGFSQDQIERGPDKGKRTDILYGLPDWGDRQTYEPCSIPHSAPSGCTQCS